MAPWCLDGRLKPEDSLCHWAPARHSRSRRFRSAGALLYLPGHPRQQLLRALSIPALSPGWKASFQDMLDQTGQAAGQPLLRSYSLSGPPGARNYRVSVKRESRGAASQFLHTRVRAGDTLKAAAPRGTFTLRASQAPVLLISAGVGATPVLAMLHALAAARSGREIWWLHGPRSRADEPFAADSRALLAVLPRAHRHICYSSPGPDDVQGRDYDTLGRLSAPVLTALDLPHDAEAYLCGPPAFMADVSAALAAGGIQAARIRTEVFGAEAALTPGIAPAAARRPTRRPGAGSVLLCCSQPRDDLVLDL
jgi:ferredoxin-NADP reductase